MNLEKQGLHGQVKFSEPVKDRSKTVHDRSGQFKVTKSKLIAFMALGYFQNYFWICKLCPIKSSIKQMITFVALNKD